MKPVLSLRLILIAFLGLAIGRALHATPTATTNFDAYQTGAGKLVGSPFTGVTGFYFSPVFSDPAADPVQGVLASSPLGTGKAGYLGGGGTGLSLTASNTFLGVVVFPGAPTDVPGNRITSGQPLRTVTADFVLQRNSGTNSQAFGFYLYDAVDAANPDTFAYHSYVQIGADNRLRIADNSVALAAASYNYTATDYTLTPGVAYRLTISVDYTGATWSATVAAINGSQSFPVATDRAINTGGYTLSGWTTPTVLDIEMGATVSSTNRALADRLVFDNLTTTDSARPAPGLPISFDTLPIGPGRLVADPTHGFTGFVISPPFSNPVGDRIQGVLSSSALGSGRAGYLGGAGTDLPLQATDSFFGLLVFPGGLSDVPANRTTSGAPYRRVATDFLLQRNGGTNQQAFNFYVYDARDAADPDTFGYHSYVHIGADNRVGIADNSTALAAAGYAYTPTPYVLQSGVAYRLVISVDYLEATWSATILARDGSAAFPVALNRPINTGGYVLSGWTTVPSLDFEMSGIASTSNRAFADRLVFDNTDTVDSAQPPVPEINTFESFAAGAGKLYTTPFTGFTAFVFGPPTPQDLINDAVQGILDSSPLGTGKAGYLGGAGTGITIPATPTFLGVGVFSGQNNDPELNLTGSVTPVFRSSLDFIVQRNGGTNQQGFSFYSYDAQDHQVSETFAFHSYVHIESDNRITIADNGADLAAANFVYTDTGFSIRPGVAYHLDYAVNYDTARWSATLTSHDGLDRFPVAINRPINSSRYTLSGWTTPSSIDIEMSAVATSANRALADRIVFDNVASSFERVTLELATISKEITYVQTAANTVSLTGADYGFYAEVDGPNINLIAPPVLTGPINESNLGATFHNGGRLSLGTDLDDSWDYGVDGDNAHFDTKAANDASFGTGTYTFTVNGVPLTITLPADAYPTAPVLTLSGGAWSNGEYVIPVDQPLGLTTSTYTGYGTHLEDRIEMFLEQDNYDGPALFEIIHFASTSPTTSSLSQTIPAGTLVAGQTYSAGAGFSAFVNKNSTLPGVVAGAFYDSSSDLRIRAVKATPALTWPAPAAITYGTALSATQLNASAGPVAGTFTYTPAAGTVLGAGANQTLEVTFNPTNPAAYNSVTTTTTITVNKAAQTITFGPLGNLNSTAAPFALSATASSGLPVAFTVSGPATLSGNTLTLTGAGGTVTVTANQSGNANYLASESRQQSFTVTVISSQTISFNALADRIVNVAPFALDATASSGLAVAFEIVSGPATLGADGKTVTLTGTPGTVVIRATQPGGDRNGVTYTAAPSVQRSFAANPVPLQSQSITFAQPAPRTFGAAPAPLVATATSNLAVRFEIVSSTPTGIAGLGSDGTTLTVTGAGSIKIRATQPGDTTYSAAEAVERDLVVNKAAQSITFAAPADRDVGAPAFALSATASSGLPVAFTVSGPATLSGTTLTLTGTAGTVTVTAQQAGNANYLAAADLPRSFTVTAGPPTIAQKITFAQPTPRAYGDAPFALVATTDAARLAVTFTVVSSTPAGIASLADDAKTLTLSGAGSVVLRADQPGDATRKPATAVTRTLVVNKKTLLVSGVSVTRLAGQDNPALALDYTGFVNGDDSTDLAATRPKAGTKATKSSAPGDYAITFTGGVDKNYTFAPGPVENLTVVGFGGTYEALLEVGGRFPVGKLTLTIPASALTYSGTLTLARETKPIPVASTSKSPGTTAFVGSTDFANAAATWTRTTNGLDALELSVTVSADGTLAGSLDRNGEPFATLAHGARLRTFAKGQTARGAGANTLALHSAYNLFEDGPLPGGSGFATAPIAPTTGLLTLKGSTADGSPLTASLKPTLDDTYLLWVNPYGTRAESYLAGALPLQDHPETTRFPGRAYIPRDAGLLTWQKAALPANTATAKLDKSYRAGFGPLGVEVSLDPWLPPSARAVGTIPAGTLAQRLGLAANATSSGALTISHGPEDLDLGARESLLPFGATLSSAGVFTAANAAATTWTIKIIPSTGAFTGSFTLSDQVTPAPAKPVARKVDFSGVLRQAPADESEVATGFFLVPGFPVPKGSAPTEQPSGEIRFSAP